MKRVLVRHIRALTDSLLRPTLRPQVEVIGVGVHPAPWSRSSVDLDNKEGSSADDWNEVLNDALWLAVPKKKKSYSRKRMRQNNPAKALKNIQHFYPCPKCEKGLLKLRHHVCPCDLVKINKPAKKVQYGSYNNREE